MGTERTTFLIDETGIIRKIYTKVKPQGHAELPIGFDKRA